MEAEHRAADTSNVRIEVPLPSDEPGQIEDEGSAADEAAPAGKH
jgi:hypothetical protein